jgi:heme exporter protein D
MEQSTNFLDMGGYAFYVWTSYGLSLIVLLLNYLLPRAREKKLIERLVKISKLKNTDF